MPHHWGPRSTGGNRWYRKGIFQSMGCMPTLQVPDGSELDPACSMALIALGTDGWSGRWTLTMDERLELMQHIDGCVDGFRDSRLAKDELEMYLDNEDNRKFILTLPRAVHGLCVQELVDELFVQFDNDDSGYLEIDEWNEILDFVGNLHLNYMLMLSFQTFRAFYCRGQTWKPDFHHHDNKEKLEGDLKNAGGKNQRQNTGYKLLTRDVWLPTFQCGWDKDLPLGTWNPIPQGWWQDLWFYSANNHPLHSIFSCNVANPCTSFDRLAMEIGTMGLTLFTLNKHQLWVVEGEAPYWWLANPGVFNLVMVTVPGLIIWWLLFLLFSCPRIGYIDESIASPSQVRQAYRINIFFAVIGYAHVAIGVLTVFNPQSNCDISDYWKDVIIGRLKGYFISSMLMVFVYFNPLIAWGQPNPGNPWNMGDLIGLGQWTIEKQKFQAVCRLALNKILATSEGLDVD